MLDPRRYVSDAFAGMRLRQPDDASEFLGELAEWRKSVGTDSARQIIDGLEKTLVPYTFLGRAATLASSVATVTVNRPEYFLFPFTGRDRSEETVIRSAESLSKVAHHTESPLATLIIHYNSMVESARPQIATPRILEVLPVDYSYSETVSAVKNLVRFSELQGLAKQRGESFLEGIAKDYRLYSSSHTLYQEVYRVARPSIPFSGNLGSPLHYTVDGDKDMFPGSGFLPTFNAVERLALKLETEAKQHLFNNEGVTTFFSHLYAGSLNDENFASSRARLEKCLNDAVQVFMNSPEGSRAKNAFKAVKITNILLASFSSFVRSFPPRGSKEYMNDVRGLMEAVCHSIFKDRSTRLTGVRDDPSNQVLVNAYYDETKAIVDKVEKYFSSIYAQRDYPQRLEELYNLNQELKSAPATAL